MVASGWNPALVAVERAAPPVALLLSVFYAIFVSQETIAQRLAFETRAYDLGIMENVLWNTIHGDVLRSSMEGGSDLGVHSSFLLLTFAPFYALWPRPETLLVAQSLLLAAAGLAAYLLGARLLRSRIQGLLWCFVFLSHPAVAGANFYDFHELAFVPLLFFLMAYFDAGDSPIGLALSAGALLLVKEGAGLLVALYGAAGLLASRKRALALLAVGAGSFFVMTALVMPRFGGGASNFIWYYPEMAGGFGGPFGVILTLVLPLYVLRFVFDPRRVLYVLLTLAPFGFLLLLVPPALVGALFVLRRLKDGGLGRPGRTHAMPMRGAAPFAVGRSPS